MINIIKLGIALLYLVGVIAYGAVATKMVAALTHVTRQAQDDTPANHQLSFTDVSFTPRGENIKLDGWYNC